MHKRQADNLILNACSFHVSAEVASCGFASGISWSLQRPIYAALRYQLVALATYLPKGYLVAAATYLRCATVRQASVAAALRYQLVALATYLRCAPVHQASAKAQGSVLRPPRPGAGFVIAICDVKDSNSSLPSWKRKSSGKRAWLRFTASLNRKVCTP